jgi:hypothetical protein
MSCLFNRCGSSKDIHPRGSTISRLSKGISKGGATGACPWAMSPYNYITANSPAYARYPGKWEKEMKVGI